MLNLEDIVILQALRELKTGSKSLIAQEAAKVLDSDPMVVRVGVDRMIASRFIVQSYDFPGQYELSTAGNRRLTSLAAAARTILNSIY